MVEAGVRSQVSLREVCDGENDIGIGLSPSISVFPSQYHSTNAPYSHSPACCFYPTDKGAKPANLLQSNARISEIWEH
jgi:hypothetical protein